MTSKKIAIIAPALLPIPALQSGGIEQLIENIINQNEIEQRVHFTIISAHSVSTKKLEKKYNQTEFKNIYYNFFGRCFNFIDRKFISILLNKNHLHWGIVQTLRIIKNNNFDKVIIFGNDHQILPLSKVVEKEKLIYYQGTLMLQKATDFLLCDKLFVGSSHSKTAILNHLPKLDYEKVKLIQSGIDINYFTRKEGGALRHKYYIDSDIPIIGYLGRIVASKGVAELLKAALIIKDKIPFKIILMGTYGSNFGGKRQNYDIKEELEIKKMVAELGEKCIVTGFVSNDILPEFLSDIDIGLVPSIVEDVSPLTYFQYQAMGIPTIVSDAGGIPEFYSSDYSLLVHRGSNMSKEISNALLSLIKNTSKRKEMGVHLNKNRENLGVQRYYNNFVDLITE